MKISLKFLGMITLTAVMAVMVQSCGSKSVETKEAKIEAKAVSATQDVKMVYFHATRRCATCNAVEQVTKETVAKHYNNKIPFESINRDEDKNQSLVEKYKIDGQTLLLIRGDEVINLTNDAFMYARVKPVKFEEILIENINKVIL